ncbi:zinc finger protein OZF-like [Chrysoperla carnea]|uniref:zinc finger protein OZF-like n=1 Tax=Chrysoperla carnea TaxID=189513 RepID=UPI001D08120B|nr:zinc finger protein OZF-like [Chrysoperla carnea]
MNAYLQSLQCRLCAEWKLANELINIKEEEAINLNLELKIQQCLNLNFVNTQLPNNVCLLCCDKVGSTYEFQELVKKAQQCLLNSIAEKKTNLKTKFPESENDSYQYVQSVLNDYEDDVSINEDEDLIRSKVQTKTTGLNNKSSKKRCERKRRKGDRIPRKNGKTAVTLDPDTAKQRAERSELIRQIKDEWKLYKWKCILCETIYTSVEEFRNHFKNDHKQNPIYSCTECSKVYELYDTFKRHVGSHRNKFKFKCHLCSRYFHRSKLYKDHLETHTTVKRCTCPKCGKIYKTSNTLRVHLRTHQVISKRKYECEFCDKKLNTKSGLLYHKKIHLGEKDFTCDQCGKTFLINSSLKYHVSTVHSDDKPFCCEHCQRTFKTQRLLKVHLQVHSDEKRHACEVCGKRFHRKESLSLHSSVHTGVLAYACEYCHKAFRTKQLLQVHVRQHTGERPYACLECNHHFTNSSNYIKHMRGKHGVMSTRKNATYRVTEPPVEKEKPIKN